MKLTTRSAAALLGLLCPALLDAGALDSKVSRSIPDDVYVMSTVVDTPANDFAEAHWARVFQSVVDSGIVDELMNGIMADIAAEAAPEEKAQVDAIIAQAKEIVGSIDWRALAKKQFVFAGRYDPANPLASMPLFPPDFVIILEGENAAKNAAAFKTVFEKVSALEPTKMPISSAKFSEFDTTTIRFGGFYPLQLATRDDVIMIGIGQGLPTDFMQLYSGTGTKPLLVDSQRFKDSFKGLPEPEVSFSFTDFDRFFNVIEPGARKLLDVAKAQMEGAKEPDGDLEPAPVVEGEEPAATPDAAATPAPGAVTVNPIELASRAIDLVFRELRSLDRIAAVQYVEGRSIATETVTFYGAKANESLFKKAFVSSNKSFEGWYKYVPAGAKSLSASSGMDMGVLYHGLIDEVKGFPGGDDIIKQYDAALAQVGFNPDTDIFSWLSGEFVSFELPAPIGATEALVALKVKDEAKAKDALDRVFAFANGKLSGGKAAPIVRRASGVLGPDFQIYTHPQTALFIRPVIGIKDGMLFFSSSEGTLQKSLDVAAGKGKNFVEGDTRMQNILQGRTMSYVKYSDLGNLGPEMAQAMMMASLMSMAVQSDPNVPKSVKSIFTIMQRSSQPLQQINFLESSLTLGMNDERTNAYRTVGLMTYKDIAPPAAPEAPKEPAEPEAPEAPKAP